MSNDFFAKGNLVEMEISLTSESFQAYQDVSPEMPADFQVLTIDDWHKMTTSKQRFKPYRND
ncbi:hypothetical protein [Curvivirga aplysinae]|uniref:hypothetical protein n=1 Tax=Curvivirga aplysinae TaxID=2529852 RepID=UPI0012BCFBB2|nr:hypothetical protein [Curvivirga aplysinae]MTI08782.1 hypothetical protein [Curvivirga aplysinae]